ncbi:unnamed protein product [Timema podura]|uniref:Muscleblind-like CCCH zinc finger domain-containing protein n=1 Tax=Timema podura TaxID=61482 RepID=A0ABN7NJV3_TIMPD|nr:unnamed protein product [Timema podura]
MAVICTVPCSRDSRGKGVAEGLTEVPSLTFVLFVTPFVNVAEGLVEGRCNREKPPCKYFHPPQHLKDQLLINGRNHLALKNALMQQMGLTPPGQALIPGQVPAVVSLSSDSFFWFMVLPSFFCVSYLPAKVGGKLQFATPLTLGQPLMVTWFGFCNLSTFSKLPFTFVASANHNSLGQRSAIFWGHD